MAQTYSQTRAMLAITKASLRSIFKSPQAVFFSLFFPIVLIIIFGSLGRGNGISMEIAFEKNTDTLNPVYFAIKNTPVFKIVKGEQADLEDRMKKGRITALIGIKR